MEVCGEDRENPPQINIEGKNCSVFKQIKLYQWFSDVCRSVESKKINTKNSALCKINLRFARTDVSVSCQNQTG